MGKIVFILSFIALALGIIITGAAQATNVNTQLGQFLISFTVPDNISVSKDPMYSGETYEGSKYNSGHMYLLNATDHTWLGTIEFVDYDKAAPNLSKHAANLAADLGNGVYIHVETYNRTIDGKPGYLIVGNNASYTQTEIIGTYHPDNRVELDVLTILPWDYSATELFDTLHVKRT